MVSTLLIDRIIKDKIDNRKNNIRIPSNIIPNVSKTKAVNLSLSIKVLKCCKIKIFILLK